MWRGKALLSYGWIWFVLLLKEEAIVQGIPDQVIQCIFIEYREIGIQCLSQYMFKPAYRRDDTGVVGSIEALHQVEVLFCLPDDCSDIDILWGLGELDPAVPPADRLDDAHFAKLVSHLHEVILRNAVGISDFLDIREFIRWFRCQKDQHA